MKITNKILIITSCFVVASCVSGRHIKDVDFPATPLDMTKITKKGKACWDVVFGASGNGSIIEAAKNGDIKTVHMVEYGDEFEYGGFKRKSCVFVYGN